MDPEEIELEDVDWIHLAQNRGQWQGVVNTVINLLAPQNGGYLSKLLRYFLQLTKLHSLTCGYDTFSGF
jgi:hypothetical protein